MIKSLTLEKVEEIVFHKRKIFLHPKNLIRMKESLRLLRQWEDEGRTIYGLNTGFGILSDIKIPKDKTATLQKNLILSHACGVGDPFSEEEVRTIILLKAHCLAQGYSGVRPLIVEKLLELLNKNHIPFIPKKGSVGASGDLAPLAHLALALIQKPFSIELKGREGLALVNGTQVMTALSALNIIKAKKLLRLFEVVSALSIEAFQGSCQPFDAFIHDLRPHPGQRKIAKNILHLLKHSDIQNDHKHCNKIQDPYSFRCIPQVQGSSQDAIEFAQKIVETELNSITDNPIIFVKQKKFVNGGNFHGQYLSMTSDVLSIAVTTLINISERRIEKLLDPKFSNLPTFLSAQEGLESGLMLAHVTSSALASESKILSHPASVDSIPTSGNKEDHVSMGVHAALKAKEILKNAEDVLAIEFLAASQGIEFRRPLKTSPLLEKVMRTIRSKVPPIKQDRIFSKDIHLIKTLFPKILAICQK